MPTNQPLTKFVRVKDQPKADQAQPNGQVQPVDLNSLPGSPEWRAAHGEVPLSYKAAGMLTRLLANVGSGIVGSVPSPFTTPFAAGIGGGGEYIAQQLENPSGTPPDKARIALEAGLSAIPLGRVYKAGQMGFNVARGAGLAELGNVARRKVETGSYLPHSLGEAGSDLLSTGLGGAFGVIPVKAYQAKGEPTTISRPTSIEGITQQATNAPVDLNVRPAPRPSGLVVRTGEPEVPKVAEVKSNVRAQTVGKQPLINQIDEGIDQASQIGKANRTVNETARKAEAKQLSKEAAADLQDTRTTLGGTTIESIQAAQAKQAVTQAQEAEALRILKGLPVQEDPTSLSSQVRAIDPETGLPVSGSIKHVAEPPVDPADASLGGGSSTDPLTQHFENRKAATDAVNSLDDPSKYDVGKTKGGSFRIFELVPDTPPPSSPVEAIPGPGEGARPLISDEKMKLHGQRYSHGAAKTLAKTLDGYTHQVSPSQSEVRFRELDPQAPPVPEVNAEPTPIQKWSDGGPTPADQAETIPPVSPDSPSSELPAGPDSQALQDHEAFVAKQAQAEAELAARRAANPQQPTINGPYSQQFKAIAAREAVAQAQAPSDLIVKAPDPQYPGDVRISEGPTHPAGESQPILPGVDPVTNPTPKLAQMSAQAPEGAGSAGPLFDQAAPPTQSDLLGPPPVQGGSAPIRVQPKTPGLSPEIFDNALEDLRYKPGEVDENGRLFKSDTAKASAIPLEPVKPVEPLPISGEPISSNPTSDEIGNLPPAEQDKLIAELVRRFKENKARGIINNQKGEANPMLLARAGLGLGGAAIGAATDPDDPLTGALLGGGVGAALPSAISPLVRGLSKVDLKTLVERLPNIQRFSMLSGLNSLAPNMIAAPLGLTTTTGGEKLLQGAIEKMIGQGGENATIGWNLLKQLRTLPKRGYHAFGEAGDILSDNAMNVGESLSPWQRARTPVDQGISAPATAITAAHMGVRDAGLDAGMSLREAQTMALGNEPNKAFGPGGAIEDTIRTWGQALQKLKTPVEGKPSIIANMVAPFTRTATNVLAATPTRTPGVGLLVKMAGGTNEGWTAVVAQQGMGTAVGAASYELGQNVTPESAKVLRKWVRNFGGRYGVVALMGFEAGQAKRAGATGKEQVDTAAAKWEESLPMPTTEAAKDWVGAGMDLLTGHPSVPRSMIPFALAPDKESSLNRFVAKPIKPFKRVKS